MVTNNPQLRAANLLPAIEWFWGRFGREGLCGEDKMTIYANKKPSPDQNQPTKITPHWCVLKHSKHH